MEENSLSTTEPNVGIILEENDDESNSGRIDSRGKQDEENSSDNVQDHRVRAKKKRRGKLSSRSCLLTVVHGNYFL